MAIDALAFDLHFDCDKIENMTLRQISFWLERATKHRKAQG